MIIELKLKVINGLSGTIYKIEEIVEKDDNKELPKSKCVIGDREYSVGQSIIDDNLYRLKIPGVMLIYRR